MRGQSQRTRFQRHIDELKSKVTGLEEQINDVRARIKEVSPVKRNRRRAVVDRLRCTGCKLCEQLCPVGAIRVTYVAHVDAERCTGCGICVENCQQGAIRLSGEIARLQRQ